MKPGDFSPIRRHGRLQQAGPHQSIAGPTKGVDGNAAHLLAQHARGNLELFGPNPLVLLGRQGVPQQLRQRGERMLPSPAPKSIHLANIIH